jgi:hypothetical protein
MLAAMANGRYFSAYAGNGSRMSCGRTWMLLSSSCVTVTTGGCGSAADRAAGVMSHARAAMQDIPVGRHLVIV